MHDRPLPIRPPLKAISRTRNAPPPTQKKSPSPTNSLSALDGFPPPSCIALGGSSTWFAVNSGCLLVLDGALSSAQLEVGDRVLEIDGVDTGILSHREIDLLFQRSSTRITLLILKKNKKKEVRVERETWEELRHPDVGFWDNDYLERNESNAGRFTGRVDKQELWNSRESPTRMQPLARSPSLEFKGYREDSFPARERARSCDPPPEERLPKSPAVHKIHSSNPFLYDNHRDRWRQGDGVAPKGREEKRAAKEIIGEHLRRRPDWRRHNSVPSAQLKKPSDFLSTRSMSCEEKTQAVGVPPRPHRDQSKPEDVNFEKSGQKFSHTFTGPKRSGRIRRMAEKLFKLPSAEDVRLPPRGQHRDSDEYSRRRREEGAECAAHDKIKRCEPHLPPSVPNNKFLSRESLRNEDVKLEDKMTEFETSKRAASSSAESRIGKSGQGLPHNEPVLSENDKVHPIFCHSGENKFNSMHPTDTGSNFRHDEIKSSANSLLNPPNDFGNNKANINTQKKNTRTTCDGTEFPIDYAKEKEIRSEMYVHETNKTRSEKVSFVEKPSAGTVEIEEHSAENVAGEKSFCSRVEHNFLDARKVPGGPRATSSANTRHVGYKLSDWEGDTGTLGSYNPHAYKERKWENSNSRDGGRSWERRGDRFGYERDEFGRNSYENRQNGEEADGSKHRQLPQAGSASDNRQTVTTTPRPPDATHAVQPGRPEPTRTLATRYYDVDHKKKKGSVEARSDDAKQLYGSEPIEGFDRQTAKESDYHYYYPASTSKNTPSRARTNGTEYCAPVSYQRFTNFSEQKDSNSPSELSHRDGNTSRGNTDWWRDKANLSKPNGTDLGRSYKFLDVDFNKNTTQYAKNDPIRAISSGPAVDTDRLHVQPEFRQLANTKLSDLGISQSASLPPTVDAYEQYSYNEPCENVGSIDEQINFNSELSFRNPSAIGKDAFDINSEENGGRESDLIEFKSIPVSQEIYNVIQNIPAPISKSTPNVVEEPFKDYVQDTDVKDSQIRPNSDRPTLDEEQLKINTGQNRKTSENLTVESNLTESGIFSKSTESNNNFPIKDRFEGDGDEKRGESPGERSFSKASEESFATPAWDGSSWKASQSSSVGRFVSAEQLDHQPSCELKTCLASSEKNLTCETILKWADEIMAEEETRRNTEEEHYESRSETVVKDNGETAKKEIKERFSEISDNTNCTTQFSEGVRSEKHVASRTYMDYDRVSTESNLSPGQQPSKSAIEETIVVTKKSDHKEESEEMSSTRWGGESIKSWNERKNDSKSIRKEHIINEAGGYQESVPNPHPFANCRPQDSNTNGEHGPAKILKEEFREKKFTSEEKHWSILREATTAPADCRPSADGKQQERSTNKERTEEDIKHYGFGPGQGPYEAEWEDGKYLINATKEQNVSERMNAQTNEELMSPKFDIVKDSSRPREEYCYKISGERVGAHSDRLADVSKEARSNRHETTDSSGKAESARETIKEKFSNLPCDQISERITSVNMTQINETDRLERVQSLSTSLVKEDATKISRNTEDGDKHESSSVHRERSDDREDMFSVRSEETAMGRCAARGGETPPGHGAAGGVAIERQRTTSALSNICGQEGANIKADGSGDRDDCRSGGILSDRADTGSRQDDTPPGFYDNHPSPPPQPKTFQELQSRLRSLLSGNDSLRHGSIVRAKTIFGDLIVYHWRGDFSKRDASIKVGVMFDVYEVLEKERKGDYDEKLNLNKRIKLKTNGQKWKKENYETPKEDGQI
ncbi:hypothetical protein AAG570_006938 [Ranatra chinensis]|uniref:PDZ domain-containing protein n=1 Tax=Ranatra chinensis TaxID=642074 RepID=A0ABD0YVI3_9HEMI